MYLILKTFHFGNLSLLLTIMWDHIYHLNVLSYTWEHLSQDKYQTKVYLQQSHSASATKTMTVAETRTTTATWNSLMLSLQWHFVSPSAQTHTHNLVGESEFVWGKCFCHWNSFGFEEILASRVLSLLPLDFNKIKMCNKAYEWQRISYL